MGVRTPAQQAHVITATQTVVRSLRGLQRLRLSHLPQCVHRCVDLGDPADRRSVASTYEKAPLRTPRAMSEAYIWQISMLHSSATASIEPNLRPSSSPLRVHLWYV
jgi:hypothetical protein